jgi:hypothetical protein
VYQTKITTTLSDGAKFVSWDKFSAEERTVQLGSKTLTQERSLEGILTSSPQIKEIASVTITPKRSNTLVENKDLISEELTYLPVLNKEHFGLTLRARVPQLNLAGVYNIEVTGELDRPTRPATFLVIDYDKVDAITSVQLVYRYYPLSTCPVNIDIASESILRIVEVESASGGSNGHKTIDESDDNVTFIMRSKKSNSPAKPNVPLLASEALEVSGFVLVKPPIDKSTDNRVQRGEGCAGTHHGGCLRFLPKFGSEGNIVDVQFESYSTALKLLRVLRQNPARAKSAAGTFMVTGGQTSVDGNTFKSHHDATSGDIETMVARLVGINHDLPSTKDSRRGWNSSTNQPAPCS